MASIDILGWNVEQGGYDNRHLFDDPEANHRDIIPEREKPIQRFIDNQRLDGVDTVALSDTYGWRERYGSDDEIAQQLGFAAARFTPLNDDRIKRVLGPGAGLTFATDHTIEQSRPLDLDNRQGLGAILNLDGKSLQVALAYLDDMNETIRLNQVRAMLDDLEDEPTVIISDNTLRPNMRGASISTKVRDLGFRGLAFAAMFVPSKARTEPLLETIGHGKLAAMIDYYKQAIINLNQRSVVPTLEAAGWHDADPQKRPTFRKLGGLGVDCAFSNDGIVTQNFRVMSAKGKSDHDAIRLQAHLA